MKCCSKCIGDKHLHKTDFSNSSSDREVCPYCFSVDQILIEPTKLQDYFDLLKGCYTINEDGKTLVEWFKGDWELFQILGLGDATLLLSNILDDGDITRKKFLPLGNDPDQILGRWEEFRMELMHKNRFFPISDIDPKRLAELLGYLILDKDDYSQTWYRARIQRGDTPYTASKMGPPPKTTASHGRANPAGIPYLYLASDTQTAISEIRPHTGEVANVAEFKIPNDINIVDLRDPRHTVSPFLVGDESQITLLRGDLRFLQQLGKELTKPVHPNAVAIDYIPTQYVCEFVKKSGYDGVMYRSSVGEGENIALFDPECGVIGGVTAHCVSRVSVEIEAIT